VRDRRSRPRRTLGVRTLWQLIRADFLERTRRYTFLVTLGVMLYAGYVAVPPKSAQMLTVNLGRTENIRGIYNSAWVGSSIALLTTMLLSLPGFYLVKNALSRDRRTGVGQIIATTPLPKVLYTLGKTLSNFSFLAVIMLIVLVGAGGTQWIRGEVIRLRVGQLLTPFVLVSLPAMTVVAALAVLFETIPFLRGGVGNVVYFILYIVFISVSMTGATFNAQGIIEAPINDLFGATIIGASMLQDAQEAYPDLQFEYGIGYAKAEGGIRTFRWEGVDWTLGLAVRRLIWVGVALGLVLVASLTFDRFDPARTSRRDRDKPGPVARLTTPLRRIHLPSFNLGRLLGITTLPLPPLGRALIAEVRLALKGLRWWWYVVALGLVIAGATTPLDDPTNRLLPLAWIWPLLVWSKFGVRESRHHTEPVVFSTPHPLGRQFVAAWLAGVLVTMAAGSGVALTMLRSGLDPRLLAWISAAVFIPTLALALGVWSGSSKLFEALYMVIWYIGPISGLASLDFMGATADSIALQQRWFIPLVTVVLLGLAALGRARMIRR
jgi:hypothetical protein